MAIRGSAPNALHLTVLMSSSSLIHSDHIFIPPPNSYSTAHLASWPLARVRSRCGSQLIVLGFPQLHNIGDILYISTCSALRSHVGSIVFLHWKKPWHVVD